LPGVEDYESMLRAMGIRCRRLGDSLVFHVEDRELGEVGLALTVFPEAGVVRVAAPLDVEPTEEGLPWYLEENFSSPTYKYALDPEGFVTVVYDAPAEWLRTARELREAILYVVEGVRRLMRRVSPS